MNIPNIKSNPYPSISNYQNQSSNAQACGFSEVAGLPNAENMEIYKKEYKTYTLMRRNLEQLNREL